MRTEVTPVGSPSTTPRGRRIALDLDALPVPAVTLGGDGETVDGANAGALALLADDPRGRRLQDVLPGGSSASDLRA